MKIFNAYNREIKGNRPVLDEIGVGTVRDRYSSYPSHGLTPERLASIFREADTGDVGRQAELFEEMEEKDAHLGSVLQTRKIAVTGLQWEIASASKDREDEAAAAFIKDALARIEDWDGALLHMLDAIGKGFSVSEIMWEVSDGRAWIKGLRWRHQKMFTFTPPPPPLAKGGMGGVADFPRLLTDSSPVYGEELTPNKFVVHSYSARSGVMPRAGVLRPCAYMYLFKNYSLKDWIIFNERFAMPARIGRFNASSTEADRKVLRNAVFNLGTDAAAVISDSTVIELLESRTKSPSADTYERLVSFCDSAMSKAVLGQTLTAEQTGGAYATAKVHQGVRQDILEADASALARTITMQVIRPLVGFNFGGGRKLPAFSFHREEAEDLGAVAQTYAALVRDAGFDGIPVSHIHKRFGIPFPEEGEETLKGGGK
ncbi:MAG: DUF935 family protein [Thermodesulfovibrionales bacterium]|nr:DUF935 family protein [Thermodesulfovibrionales bacterium]